MPAHMAREETRRRRIKQTLNKMSSGDRIQHQHPDCRRVPMPAHMWLGGDLAETEHLRDRKKRRFYFFVSAMFLVISLES